MKTGKSIIELAQEIQRQADAKKDFVADTREIHMTDAARLAIGADESFTINEHAHRQIGDKVGIPAKYYDRMLAQSPMLLADNVNHWLHAEPERRMVRTLDGTARAFLSDRYRRIDNDDIAQVVLPILLGTPDIQVLSSEITERKMYLQAVFPRIEREVKKGDVVQAGILITNSEIGTGGFNVSPLVYRLVCLNGMIGQHALRKYHVGRRAMSEDGSYEIFSSETVQADDKALMLKVRDVVRASMDELAFGKQVEVLQAATQTSEITNPMKAIEVLTKKVGWAAEEANSVLTNIIKGGDLTKYGLLNAVTAVANTHASYDRAVEFEQLGGRILELNRSEWKELAEAA